MNYLFLALIPPVLYAIANYIDKLLISKYVKSGDVGSLVLFSSLFAVVTLPIAYFFDTTVFQYDWKSISLLILTGVLSIVAIVFYLKALFKDETSIIAPFFQLIPVFGFSLAYLFLGEVLSAQQIIAGVIMLIGALFLSIDVSDNSLSFKKTIVMLMIGSSFFYAVREVLFKFISLDIGFWGGVFWSSFGMVLSGIILFIANESYRTDFILLIRNNKIPVLSLSFINETFVITADIILYYLLLIAPVAVVQTIFSTQPVFVLLLGIVLTLVFPKLDILENIDRKSLIQKIIAITLIVIGGILLSQAL